MIPSTPWLLIPASISTHQTPNSQATSQSSSTSFYQTAKSQPTLQFSQSPPTSTNLVPESQPTLQPSQSPSTSTNSVLNPPISTNTNPVPESLQFPPSSTNLVPESQPTLQLSQSPPTSTNLLTKSRSFPNHLQLQLILLKSYASALHLTKSQPLHNHCHPLRKSKVLWRIDPVRTRAHSTATVLHPPSRKILPNVENESLHPPYMKLYQNISTTQIHPPAMKTFPTIGSTSLHQQHMKALQNYLQANSQNTYHVRNICMPVKQMYHQKWRIYCPRDTAIKWRHMKIRNLKTFVMHQKLYLMQLYSAIFSVSRRSWNG